MKPLPPSNAELRVRYAPLRAWAALSGLGLLLTVMRNVVYDIPYLPVRSGLKVFLISTLIGAAYAVAVLIWLTVRRLMAR